MDLKLDLWNILNELGRALSRLPGGQEIFAGVLFLILCIAIYSIFGWNKVADAVISICFLISLALIGTGLFFLAEKRGLLRRLSRFPE